MSERRVRALFFVVLIGQLLLLTMRVPDRAGARSSALEGFGVRLLAPLGRAVDAVAGTFGGIGQSFRLNYRLRVENAALQAELERLRIEAMRHQDLADEARRLAGALDYARRSGAVFRLVDVVLNDHVSSLRTMVVHTGPPPARLDQPVVATAGLVGRVVTVAGPYAKVQLLTDRAAAVGAMIERTRRQGLVRGDGRGGLEMGDVQLRAVVERGDRVVTSGIDGVFPRGIPLGVVTEVEEGGALFHRIRLAPAVDFGLLDQVYLLERPPVPPELREDESLGRP